MELRTHAQIIEDEKTFFLFYDTLKENDDLICNTCLKKSDNLALLIDYKNNNLINKECSNHIHERIHRFWDKLNRKQSEFVNNLSDAQRLAQRLYELQSMDEKERLISIKNQLKLLKSTLKDLEKEAIKQGLSEFI